MSMIRVEDLTFAYSGSSDPVYDHANFQIDTEWKLGFLGRNGRGKTTFLRLLMGEYPHGGSILGAPPCAYFPDTVRDPSQVTLEVLCGLRPEAEAWEFLRETGLLGVDAGAAVRPDHLLRAPGHLPPAGEPAGLCPGERCGRDAAAGDPAEAGFFPGAV